MCTVAAAAIAVGVAQTGVGIMQAQEQTAYANAVAKSKYEHAKRAAERNNQIATQNYNNKLRILEQKDKVKKEDYEAQIKAYEAALAAGSQKTRLNAAEANRAHAEVSAKRKEANVEAAFKMEESVATMIKAQGELLSTGGTGQSFLLQTEDPLRILGMASERIGETLYNRHQTLNLEQMGVSMDHLSSEWATYNNIPAAPRAQRASLLPYKPIHDPGPSGYVRRSSGTAIASAVVGGVSAGIGAGFSLSGGEAMSTWGGMSL